MLSAISYVFWHKGAILREFKNNTISWVQHALYVLVAHILRIKIKSQSSQNVHFVG